MGARYAVAEFLEIHPGRGRVVGGVDSAYALIIASLRASHNSVTAYPSTINRLETCNRQQTVEVCSTPGHGHQNLLELTSYNFYLSLTFPFARSTLKRLHSSESEGRELGNCSPEDEV
jgi:hypothetical protein